MAFNTKYQVPDFQLSEFIRAYYGYELKSGPGESWYCRCPFHNHSPKGEKALRVYDHNDNRGGWLCPRGMRGNTWEFLSRAEGLPMPEDEDFDVTVEFVCEQLGIEPQTQGNYTQTAADKAGKLMRELKDALQPISFSEPNEHWQKGEDGQFRYRGLRPMLWLKYDVGMISEQKIESLVHQYGQEHFEAAGIPSFGRRGFKWISEGVVVIRPSPYGVPKGIAVRRYPQLAGNISGAKYVKNSAQSEIINTSEYLFGLHSVEDAANLVWVVEGEFDALSIIIRGVPNVVTYGSGVPSQSQLQMIQEAADHVVYVADNDANQAGFEHAARLAEKLPDMEVVFPPAGDPEEFVRSEGVEALKSAHRYTSLQVQMISEDVYDWESSAWSARRRALAKKYMRHVLSNPTVFDDRNLSMISTLSGIEQDHLKSWLFYQRNLASAQSQGNVPRLFS